MNSYISCSIKKGDNVIFTMTKSAEDMKHQGVSQIHLKTDEEPLPLSKENEVYYLGLAAEVFL